MSEPIREFKLKASLWHFMKRYIVSLLVTSILFVPLVLLRIFYSDFAFREEIIWGFAIGFPVLVLIGGAYRWAMETEKSYKFFDEFFVVDGFWSENVYEISNLEEIFRPTDAKIRKGTIDHIRLRFKNHKTVKIYSWSPDFIKMKRFLKEYLKSRVNYKKLLSGAEL